VKGSSLEAMFSGRHDIENKDGHVHLDRNPSSFKMLLEYMDNNFRTPEFVTIVEKIAFE
jgi:hypothetical protein